MNILFLGDVVGKPGREALAKYLPRLKRRLKLDFIVVNGENAAHGIGITADICHEFFDMGGHCITTGNHIWDQREIISFIDKDNRLLRPANLPVDAPGQGSVIVENEKGQKLGVINVMTQLFMKPIDTPYKPLENALAEMRLKDNVDAILVDVHGEATSEKMGIGLFCNGYASLVVGTHTHIPTADTRILDGGTAFQSDAGMCGCYDSVIGMDKDVMLHRMATQLPGERMRPAEGEGGVCGIFVQVNDETGLADVAAPVRMGPFLSETVPEIDAA